jgi:hypothetical protein
MPERIRTNRLLRLRRKSGKRFTADLVLEDFRLAKANHQMPKDSTPAMNPIFAIFGDFDGVGQVIANKQPPKKCGYQPGWTKF